VRIYHHFGAAKEKNEIDEADFYKRQMKQEESVFYKVIIFQCLICFYIIHSVNSIFIQANQ
jgi:hypothetical protein